MGKSRQLANASTLGAVSNVITVPVGTTAQRPPATAGYIRYNTDLNTLESANGTAWANVGSGSSSSGGGVSWQPVQNTSFIAVKNNGYLVNTYTGNVTVTLPSSATFGDIITFVDYGGYMSANALILYPNGNKILGNTANSILTTNTASVSLVYTDNNKGWVPYNGFTSSPVGNYFVEALIIAGGGGAYYTGGGGAGGMLSSTTVTVIPGVPYTITVGSGGGDSTSGSPSTFAGLTAIGGGGGIDSNGYPNSGGSGAGSIRSNKPGGAGTAGQGNPGGGPAADGISSYTSGCGGGGAGATGSVPSGQYGGPGGTGLQSSFNGTTTYYAGGGSGGGDTVTQSIAGSPGGGGAGAGQGQVGSSGATNSGGGGGGAQSGRGSGGSGRVMIRYLGGQRATGGTVTQTNGYTIHTFLSSGTFVA